MKKDWWYRFASYDTSKRIDIERKKFVLKFFTYIGATIVLLFGFLAPDDQVILKYSLLAAGTFFALNLFIARFHKRIEITVFLTGFVIITMVLIVVYTGGHQNTGLYWTYPFPITLFIFFGYRFGLFLNIALLIGISILVLTPDLTLATYRIEEISRYFASYVVNVLLCLIGEYFRYKSHAELTDINIEKQKQANTDSLTGLPNRRFIDSIFFESANNTPEQYFPMGIAIIDVDYFKSINDNYGHDVGDLVLKHVTKTVSTVLRKSDVVARIGGEEFLIIFPGMNLINAHEIAEKVRTEIERTPYKNMDINHEITVSIGCALVEKANLFDQAVKIADQRLYQAKTTGRNRVIS